MFSELWVQHICSFHSLFNSTLIEYWIYWIHDLSFLFFSIAQDTGSLVSRCDTSVYKDLVIHIDFYKINSSCSCTLSPMFTGYLFVLLKESSAEDCNTQVKINNAFMFNCTVPAGSNHTLNVVQSNQVVRVQAEYTQPSKQGTFHQCLEFRQYGKNFFLFL